jgi:SagB-type dehydrogenase family enzyme
MNEHLPANGISMMMHEWTKRHHAMSSPPLTMPVSPSVQKTPAPARTAWSRWAAQPAIPLPNRRDIFDSAVRSNSETLVGRRSVRVYDQRPFTTDDLSQVLTLALPPREYCTQTGYERPKPAVYDFSLCRIAFLAMNVADLERGAYLYDGASHAAIPLRNEDPRPFIQSICFQAEFTLAPVILLMCGSLNEIQRRYGDRGYRYWLMETGMILQRLYLVTSYLGMSGSISGSFTFGELERWLGFDGFNHAVAVTFVAGHRPAMPNPTQTEEQPK